MERIWITVLYAAGFALPAIGIARVLVNAHIADGRHRRNEVKAKPILEKYRARVDEINNGEFSIAAREQAEATMKSEMKAHGATYLSVGDGTKLLNELHSGNTAKHLTIAREDLLFIGSGLLASTVASIWGIWLST